MQGMAYVIFMNDTPKGVVLDEYEKSLQVKNKLRAEHMSTVNEDDVKYHDMYIWHVNGVKIIGDNK